MRADQGERQRSSVRLQQAREMGVNERTDDGVVRVLHGRGNQAAEHVSREGLTGL